MKRENAESPKQFPAGPESAELYDFLYVDRARISSLYAQLFPQGILTTVKTSSQQSFSDDNNLGSDLKIIKAEAKSTEGGSDSIEHLFDASWSIPLEVLAQLQTVSAVRHSIREAHLGAIVLAQGYLRIIDYTTMKSLWGPAMKIAAPTAPKGQKGQNTPKLSDLIEIMQGLPHSMHAHFLTAEGFLWSLRIPGEGEKDSGANVKTIPG
jgi:hypothetical protein